MEGWQATERDWKLLERTPAIQLWKLAALTFGIHPKSGITSRLPPSLRDDYRDLRAVARGAASTRGGRGKLHCESTETQPESPDNLRATLGNFAAFLDLQGIKPHPRMLTVLGASGFPADGSTAKDLLVAAGDSAHRLESMTIRAKTMARMLLGIAIQRYGLQIESKNSYQTEFAIKAIRGTYAEMAAAVADAGLPGVHATTPRQSIEFAIELLDPAIVRDVIAVFRQRANESRGSDRRTDAPGAAPMD